MNWGTPMTETDRETALLETYFESARRRPPEASDALLARVVDDAQGMQGHTAGAHPGLTARPGAVARLVRALGGWPTLAGLSTATAAGIWLGASLPAGLTDVAQDYLTAGETGLYFVDVQTELLVGLDEGAL